MIIEVNEYQKQVDNSKAAEFFFENLAKDNDSKAVDIEKKGEAKMPGFKDFHTSYVIGEHLVNQRVDNKGPTMRVRVHMAVVRLAKVTTDMLVVLSLPYQGILSKEKTEELEVIFMNMMDSFEIISWKIFPGAA
eukprot:CAMPEP_0184481394 /NCGR_PEP_ID=MMETSP0113_2-20130426/2942_1 /TAXON_ID=91329 /ORGANISM="Norrisiella sphaerica, Strain BC52" /LENGTH=133 /DNA_ID=CAMNT_0026860499 /DNA_START=230 /DNA_END=631 /DNA_ORIENTATION=+